jgi:hypothetical protein
MMEDPVVWRAAVAAAVGEFGFHSILDLMRAFPREPVGKLYRFICRPADPNSGCHVGFARFQDAIFSEAIARGQVRWVARDLLVRWLCEYLGKGWAVGKKAKNRRAKASAQCFVPYHGSADFDAKAKLGDAIWQALEDLGPPADWRPTGPDDPVIVKAFDQAWPDWS